MRPVNKVPWPQERGANKNYSPYGEAKDDLVENLGRYCSFCGEIGYYSALDVEHVQAKNYEENGVKIYEHLKEDWTNFLLGCKNCNPIKGKKKVETDTHTLPHVENTFMRFAYSEGGMVSVSNGLSPANRLKAVNTLNLVGLDRRPGKPNYSSKDKRWLRRMEVWFMAERYLDRFNNGLTDLDDLITIAKLSGFWSVWMTVFEGVSEVRQRLIKDFPGTCANCFDHAGNPIER